jgi:phosphate transport system permease protein
MTATPSREEQQAVSAPAATAGATRKRIGDRIFSGAALGAGSTILIALAGVAIFLTLKGLPAIHATKTDLGGSSNIVVYIWPLLFGTLLVAVVSLAIATPLAIGVALVISHYAPARLAKTVGYAVDLLAAVPSVVYGLWGIGYLGVHMVPVYGWLHDHLGFLPFFKSEPSATGRTIFTACIVLAIMVLPIITAITREIFAQTPKLHQEAALALGATRWEMIRLAVFPYARSGIVSAVMLGLGRALGETMAVAMVLSASGVVTFNLIGSTNPSTIAANIALKFSDATGIRVNALIASGLVLFVITFAVNFAARALISRTPRSAS